MPEFDIPRVEISISGRLRAVNDVSTILKGEKGLVSLEREVDMSFGLFEGKKTDFAVGMALIDATILVFYDGERASVFLVGLDAGDRYQRGIAEQVRCILSGPYYVEDVRYEGNHSYVQPYN